VGWYPANMTTRNPFPGMNPFFEQRWRDAHARLLVHLCETLQAQLPADLVAATDEEVVAIGGGAAARTFRPDVQVRDPWPGNSSDDWRLAEEATAPAPIHVFMDDEVERWIEIRDDVGRLITVIELLSPTNKLELRERDRYDAKRRMFLGGGANLVEIDLVRQGSPVFPDRIRETLRQAGACYGVCVFRATQPNGREVYPIRLREGLPAIRIPLRPTDEDVLLDLQPLIDQCHERGRYHRLDYRRDLDPPLAPDDAQWVDDRLRGLGLR
jgi:hypothetical protein